MKTKLFSRAMRDWFAERFPLASHGLLIVAFYSSNEFLSLALTGQPVGYDLRALGGAGILFCFFLHLRVFDEHKDYADDCVHYPERVLQSGRISLFDLKIVGALALGAELALAALLGPAALVAWSIALLFSVAMLFEFGIGRWLRDRLLLYAASHMLVMPVLAATVYSITTGRMPWTAPGWFWLWAFVSFFVGFNWEISRKIRAPEQEREGVLSYTRIFGTYGAAWAVLVVRVIDTAMVAAVGWHLALSPWFFLVLVALFAVCCTGFVQYRRAPTPATARRMETYAGIYVVAFDLSLAAFIAGGLA